MIWCKIIGHKWRGSTWLKMSSAVSGERGVKKKCMRCGELWIDHQHFIDGPNGEAGFWVTDLKVRKEQQK